MIHKRLLFAYFTLQICLAFVSAASNSTVILIALGGFRWDYMSKANTSSLDEIAGTGVRAPFVKSVFPTVTMPNLYTIVTGLYPESHGIIANEMFDPAFRTAFGSSNNETRWWDAGEPIWVTNQKQGFKSATSFWPGFDVKIRGYFPSYSTNGTKYSKPFVSRENLMPVKERIDMVIKWLIMDEPPSFVAMYFSEPDITGHKYGPDSPETEAVIKKSDVDVAEYLWRQLRGAGLLDQVNIIFTSDHGMVAFNTSNFVNFDDIVNASSYWAWSGNAAFFTIQPHPGKEKYVFDSLKKGQKNTQLFEVYKKEDVPDSLHFKNNRRIGSIVVLMNQGWYARSSNLPSTANWTEGTIRGENGYSTALKDMYPFFIARGPAFKENFTSDAFDLIDIYPMICHILGIKSAPNNGSLARVKQLFREPSAPPTEPTKISTTTESTVEKQAGNNIVKIVGFSILGFAVFVTLVASILLTVRWCKRGDRPKKAWIENEETPAIQADETQALHDETEAP